MSTVPYLPFISFSWDQNTKVLIESEVNVSSLTLKNKSCVIWRWRKQRLSVMKAIKNTMGCVYLLFSFLLDMYLRDSALMRRSNVIWRHVWLKRKQMRTCRWRLVRSIRHRHRLFNDLSFTIRFLSLHRIHCNLLFWNCLFHIVSAFVISRDHGSRRRTLVVSCEIIRYMQNLFSCHLCSFFSSVCRNRYS